MASTRAAGTGRGGGILTVIGAEWTVLEQLSARYWVGVVLRRGNTTLAVANTYIPPHNSPFAPPSMEAYRAVLDATQEWLCRMQAAWGDMGILWGGDFNAWAGPLPAAPKKLPRVALRGRAMTELLTAWGYQAATLSLRPGVSGTFCATTGTQTTVDYVWCAHPARLHGPLQLHTHHWGVAPLPSPHAILVGRVTTPGGPPPTMPRAAQPRPTMAPIGELGTLDASGSSPSALPRTM